MSSIAVDFRLALDLSTDPVRINVYDNRNGLTCFNVHISVGPFPFYFNCCFRIADSWKFISDLEQQRYGYLESLNKTCNLIHQSKSGEITVDVHGCGGTLNKELSAMLISKFKSVLNRHIH